MTRCVIDECPRMARYVVVFQLRAQPNTPPAECVTGITVCAHHRTDRVFDLTDWDLIVQQFDQAGKARPVPSLTVTEFFPLV